MTPQERQLVDELFERLARLENAPRDAEAERAISDGLSHAPHAIYPLVHPGEALHFEYSTMKGVPGR